MKATGLPALASACYSLDSSDHDWLAGVVGALGPALEAGFGVAAWQFRLDDLYLDDLRVGVTPDVSRILREARDSWPTDEGLTFLVARRAGTACERLGRSTGLDEHPFGAGFRAAGIRDFRALTVLDVSRRGVAFMAPAARVQKMPRPVTHRLDRVGAHVLSAFRLRCALGEVDAVLGPDGKVIDARHEARTPEHRGALRRAAVAFDRACTSRLTRSTDEALDGWQALISGRWSLVQSFESDGRRYLIARRNPPGAMDRAAVTPLEAHALVLRAQGLSHRLIAYELGCSVAASHLLVRRGARKLGVRNESELPALFRAHANRNPSPARAAESGRTERQ